MNGPENSKASKSIMDIDQQFGKMAIDIGKNVWSLKNLSMRHKALICIVNDVVCSNMGAPIHAHVSISLENGVSMEEIRQTLLYIAPEVGYPKVLNALIVFNELFKEIPTTINDCQKENLNKISNCSYTDLSGFKVDCNDSFIQEIYLKQFKDRNENELPSLSDMDKIIFSIAIDIFQQTLGKSFKRHLEQAKAIGIKYDELKTVIQFTTEFSISKAWCGMDALEEIKDEYNK